MRGHSQVYLSMNHTNIVNLCKDAFEDTTDSVDMKTEILSLCSATCNSNEITKLLWSMKNFNLHGWSEKECFNTLDRILPDCKADVVAQVLETSRAFLAPFYQIVPY
jgi:hypothetical protein